MEMMISNHFFVMIWFIIELKQPIKKLWLFGVSGRKVPNERRDRLGAAWVCMLFFFRMKPVKEGLFHKPGSKDPNEPISIME